MFHHLIRIFIVVVVVIPVDLGASHSAKILVWNFAQWNATLGTYSIRFFVGNGKPQTAKCHVTTALRSRLRFAVHDWTAGRASSGKWFTARFFATKNCTASRLKVWTSFLYPFAMCLLDFWSRINELLLTFGRLKWCTSTWWKQHGGPKQWTRSSNQFYIPFCRTNKGKYSVPIES